MPFPIHHTPVIAPQKQWGHRLSVIVLLLVSLLLLASCDVTDTSSTGNSTPTGASAATKPAATKPAAPTATPKPTGSHLVTAATFGGPEAAFTSAYGAPNFSESNVRHYQFTSNGTQVLLVITLDDTDPVASDGKQHVNGIGVQPADAGTTWAAATTNKVLALLLPSDAQHTKDEQVQDIGLVHVYLSADLALTFPASAFADIQTSQPLTPGTFSVECNSSNGLHGGCNFTLGA